MYQDTFYEQIEGCAMGVSLSSVIAQLVMEDLETSILKKFKFNAPFFYRYVDDCLLAIPKDKCDYVLQEFNKYHPKLQFTMEIQNNHQINFLDVTLHNKDGNIKTAWFTKPTWSGRYLNFLFQHPISQKISVIIGLADRAIALSDPEYRQEAIQKAKQALRKNSYPERLINSIFKKRINEFHNSTANQSVSKQHVNFLTLPYIPN